MAPRRVSPAKPWESSKTLNNENSMSAVPITDSSKVYRHEIVATTANNENQPINQSSAATSATIQCQPSPLTNSANDTTHSMPAINNYSGYSGGGGYTGYSPYAGIGGGYVGGAGGYGNGMYGGFGSGLGYGGGYGGGGNYNQGGMFGRFGSPYGGGAGMPLHEGGLGWLASVTQMVGAAGQVTELLGLNAEALNFCFSSFVHLIERFTSMFSGILVMIAPRPVFPPGHPRHGTFVLMLVNYAKKL